MESLDEVAFESWLSQSPPRAVQFAQFSAFLDHERVADIVPVWTLLKGDEDRIAKCGDAGFILPSRHHWANIVPPLRIVRDKIVPTVGRVTVVSVFRTAKLNSCAGGASQSRHLSFSALDLHASDQPDGRALFSKLCPVWRAAGSQSRWGLGAYFDPAKPDRNRRARFHVDATGWRSWGFSKTASTSGCALIAEG